MDPASPRAGARSRMTTFHGTGSMPKQSRGAHSLRATCDTIPRRPCRLLELAADRMGVGASRPVTALIAASSGTRSRTRSRPSDAPWVRPGSDTASATSWCAASTRIRARRRSLRALHARSRTRACNFPTPPTWRRGCSQPHPRRCRASIAPRMSSTARHRDN